MVSRDERKKREIMKHKNKKIKKTCFLFLFFLLNKQILFPIGSDTTPSRQGAVTFYESDSDNEMNGFAALENGFTLETPNTTCTFDSFFPVSGTVEMNGGSLYLLKDLLFDAGVSVNSFGSLYGSDLEVEISENVTTLTAYGSYSGSSSSFFQVDLDHFSSGIIDSVDWSYDDQYIAFTRARASAGLHVYSFNGSSLSEVDDITTRNLPYSVKAHPSGYYFIVGTETSRPKDEIRLYKLSGGSLSLLDSYDIDIPTKAVGWSADGNYSAWGTDSDIRIYSFSSESLSHVVTTAIATGASSADALCWDRTGNYVALGLTHATNSKLELYYFNGSSLTSTQNVNTGVDAVTAVDWSKTDSFIAIGTNGSADQLRV